MSTSKKGYSGQNGSDELRDYDRLTKPELNKGTAFTHEEREGYGLRGLLPAGVSDLKTQENRAMANLRRKAYDIERYVFLQALASRNERLFYRMVIDHIFISASNSHVWKGLNMMSWSKSLLVPCRIFFLMH